jgi:hypothetical protein
VYLNKQNKTKKKEMAEKNQYLKMRCWILKKRSSKCQHKKNTSLLKKLIVCKKESLMEKEEERFRR